MPDMSRETQHKVGQQISRFLKRYAEASPKKPELEALHEAVKILANLCKRKALSVLQDIFDQLHAPLKEGDSMWQRLEAQEKSEAEALAQERQTARYRVKQAAIVIGTVFFGISAMVSYARTKKISFSIA